MPRTTVHLIILYRPFLSLPLRHRHRPHPHPRRCPRPRRRNIPSPFTPLPGPPRAKGTVLAKGLVRLTSSSPLFLGCQESRTLPLRPLVIFPSPPGSQGDARHNLNLDNSRLPLVKGRRRNRYPSFFRSRNLWLRPKLATRILYRQYLQQKKQRSPTFPLASVSTSPVGLKRCLTCLIRVNLGLQFLRRPLSPSYH